MTRVRKALAWQVHGHRSDPPVVFLHGFMGTSSDWTAVLDVMRVFAVTADLPGHGGSANVTPEWFTLAAAADAVRDAMMLAGIDRACLVGYSMGGRVAAHLATRHPEMASSLVLVSAHTGLASAEARASRMEQDLRRAERLIAAPDRFIEEWGRQQLFASMPEPLRSNLVSERREADPAGLARAIAGLSPGRQEDLAARLADLPIPFLHVAGAHDPAYRALGRRLSEAGPRIEAVTIPDAGHNILRERPHALARTLTEFIEANKSTPCP